MSRIKRGVASKARHKKVLKMAKGYRGRAKSCIRVAIEKVEKGLQYAYRDRRNKKREFRAVWISRINAAVREQGMVYSTFMAGVIKEGLGLNRKMLSEMAIHQPQDFNKIVERVRAAQ